MTDVRTVKPPKIIPHTDNPAVLMALKLREQQEKKRKKEANAKDTKEKKTPKVKRAPVWAVDFEGIITSRSRFPNIGKPNVSVIELLKMARLQGVKLILWTCREGNYLNEALEWCKDHGLEFDAVNENLSDAIEYLGRNTRKVLADIYIDDKSFRLFGEDGEKKLWELVQSL